MITLPDIIFSIAFCIGTISLLISIRSNEIQNQIFSFCIALNMLWTIDISLSYIVANPKIILILTRIDHVIGIAISLLFVIFAYKLKRNWDRYIYTSILMTTLISIVTVFSDSLISKSFWNNENMYSTWEYGPVYYIYITVFIYNIILAVYRLNKHAHDTHNSCFKLLSAMLIIGFVPPLFSCVILPNYGNFELIWVGPISSVFWLIIMCYAIYKHNLFNIKIIAVEIIAFFIWLFIFLYIISGNSPRNLILELLMLIIIILLSVLLFSSLKSNENKNNTIREFSSYLKEIEKKIFDDF